MALSRSRGPRPAVPGTLAWLRALGRAWRRGWRRRPGWPWASRYISR